LLDTVSFKKLEVNMKKLFVLFTFSILLLGCVPSAPPSDQGVITPTELTPTLEIGQATAPATPQDLPFAAEYNLGETTITQSMFPEDNRFPQYACASERHDCCTVW
jgi:hypothetical protein